VEWLQRIHLVDSLGLVIPFEELQHHLVGREIDQRESMLLDRFYLLHHVEMGRRHRAGAAPARWPAERRRAAADRPGDDGRDRIGPEVELAAAQHAADADRMQVAADDERPT